jgi:hypothetical protein
MNPFVESIVSGLIANALTLWAQCSIGAYQKIPVDMVLGRADISLLLQRSISSLSRRMNRSPSYTEKVVGAFLATPEVESLMRELFATWIADQTDQPRFDPQKLTSLEALFTSNLANWLDTDPEEIASHSKELFQMLVSASSTIIEVAIASGSLSVKDAKDQARHRLILGELNAIQKKLAFSDQSAPNVPAIINFEEQYRRQVAARTRLVTPPFLTDSQPVPIDDIYVAPSIRRTTRSGEIQVEAFLRTVHRTVILGDQGAGKSTLLQKICHDVASRYESRLVGGSQLTPAIIILREYARTKEDEGCSILEFLEMQARSKYQMSSIPPRAFEYLLHHRRLILAFDGLDEVLLTHKREQIKGDVESFCTMFPAVPVIVTSRLVGYREAPLEEAEFPSLTIQPFNGERIGRYAANWFKHLPNVSVQERKAKFVGFRRDANSVRDLCANPLMLALLCHLYRVENYIPRNRPHVYRACSELMIEKWDRSRGIEYPLSYSIPLYETIQHIAHWVYGDEEKMGGVSVANLVKEVTNYLSEKRFENAGAAIRASEDFVRFCRTRASLFSDAGFDSRGNELYRFSHQTFLEYFAALFVARHNDVSKLMDLLVPRIRRREWDHFCHMAIRLKAEQQDGADDDAINRLLSIAYSLSKNLPRDCLNCFMFAARSLGHLTPRPGTIRRILRAILHWQLEMQALAFEEGKNDPFAAEVQFGWGYSSDELFSTLGSVLPENRECIGTSLVTVLGGFLEGENSLRDRRGTSVIVAVEFAKVFNEVQEYLDGSGREVFIQALAGSWRGDLRLALIALEKGKLETDEFLDHFGIISIFREVPIRYVPMSYDGSIGYQMLKMWLDAHYRKTSRLVKIRDFLTKLGERVLVQSMPCVQCKDIEHLERSRIHDLVGKADISDELLSWTSERTSAEMFGAFFILATLYEIQGQNNLTSELNSNPHQVCRVFGQLFGVREGSGRGVIKQYLDDCNVQGPEFRQIMTRWMNRQVEFANLR